MRKEWCDTWKWSHPLPERKSWRYSVFHRFRQAKFAYGGCLNIKLFFGPVVVPAVSKKELALKLVKIDLRIIIFLSRLKPLKLTTLLNILTRHENKGKKCRIPYRWRAECAKCFVDLEKIGIDWFIYYRLHLLLCLPLM